MFFVSKRRRVSIRISGYISSPKRGRNMSKLKPFHSLCAFVLALVMGLGSTAAFAQSQATTGQIAGAVTDSQGAALPNATVKATNTQTGLERSVNTSDDGLYRIVLLPPGVYKV